MIPFEQSRAEAEIGGRPTASGIDFSIEIKVPRLIRVKV